MDYERVMELACFLHEEILYDHPDPRSLQPCKECREKARKILDFLERDTFIVSDMELCQ